MVCKKSAEFVVPTGKMLGLTPSYNFLLGRNKFKGKNYILSGFNKIVKLRDELRALGKKAKTYHGMVSEFDKKIE